jgi:hypothetical protein
MISKAFASFMLRCGLIQVIIPMNTTTENAKMVNRILMIRSFFRLKSDCNLKSRGHYGTRQFSNP